MFLRSLDAQTEIGKAQERQKKAYDQKARQADIQVGTRVFVHKPALKQRKAHKFARPFTGPY